MYGGAFAALDVVLQEGAFESESLISAIYVFLVSFLIGTTAIYVGAQLFIDRDTGFRRAALTALIGAIVYVIVGLFFGWIPLLGPLLMLIAWIGVINWQYPGGWVTAGGVGLVAWLVAVVILYLLTQFGIVTPDALGVPGV